jgi:hypothetical protein
VARVTLFTHRELAFLPSKQMTSWRELEAEFRELHQNWFGPLDARIDRSWGSEAFDEWRVAGGSGPLHESRFKSLATLAGRLIESLPDSMIESAITSEADPYRRWLLAAWQHGTPRVGHGTQRAADGTESLLMFGTLEHPAAVSANLCLYFAAQTIPISSQLKHQLQAPRYAAVAAHWDKAQRFSRGEQLDLANSAKEAVSAVEALAQIVTRRGSTTLGACINDLRTGGRIGKPLLRGLEELWAFTSNSPGVRHGSPTGPTLTVAESAYIRDQAAAALRLLLSIDDAK